MSDVVTGDVAVARSRPSLRRRLLGRQNQNLWFWVFVGPFFVGLVLFIYVPIVWSAYLSFFEAYNTVTPTKAVGFGNYADMLSDPNFRSSLATFVVFAAFIVLYGVLEKTPPPCCADTDDMLMIRP